MKSAPKPPLGILAITGPRFSTSWEKSQIEMKHLKSLNLNEVIDVDLIS